MHLPISKIITVHVHAGQIHQIQVAVLGVFDQIQTSNTNIGFWQRSTTSAQNRHI